VVTDRITRTADEILVRVARHSGGGFANACHGWPHCDENAACIGDQYPDRCSDRPRYTGRA
jgi:hypothetical protein